MTENQEIMETSMNFMEQLNEEYEAQAEVEVNKEQDLQIEETEDQNIQEEISTLRYREADALIRDEIKEIISKKETDKVTLTVLSGQKNILTEQIRKLQTIRDEVGQETEELNIKSEIETDELHQLEKRVLYNGEIIEKFENFTKTINEGYKQLQTRSKQFAKKLEDQAKENFEVTNYWKNRISGLKNEIKKKIASRSNTNTPNPLKEENLVLKAKLVEKKQRLEELKQQFQEFKLKEENLKKLESEKRRLEEILNDRNQKLQELQLLKEQNQMETSTRRKQWEFVLEEKRNNLTESLKKAAELKTKVEEAKEEHHRLQNVLTSKEEHHSELSEKIVEISSKVKESKEELEAKTKKWQEEVLTAQEELKKSEEKITTINKENEELCSQLEELKQRYVTTIEEKSERLLEKAKLEQKLREDEVLLVQIKLLDENIANEEKTSEQMTQKIEDLSLDKRLQEMEKQKAYLDSTVDYFKEKLETIKKQVEDKKVEVKDKEESAFSQQKILWEKRELYENLLKEIEELKTKKGTDESQKPPSILKSPASQKKFPMSPKKVQFEGVSSYESSCSSEPGTSTIAGKTFDQILEEIQAGAFKKPERVVKKRKIDIE